MILGEQDHLSKRPLAQFIEDAIGGLWGNAPETANVDETDVLVVRGADFKNWNERRALDAAPRRVPSRFLERRRLNPGDLVLEVSGGSPAQPVGRVLMVDERAILDADRPLICSNFCRKLRLTHEVDPSFVKFQLDWKYGLGETDQFQTSTTNIRNLQVDDFLKHTDILLVPIEEQRRIASVLDDIGRIRTSVSSHLSASRLAVERFRQAILAAACTGALTADWRDQNAVEAQGSIVLESNRGLTTKRRVAIAEFKSDGLPDIPPSWFWAPLAALSEGALGKMLDKAKNKGEGLPYLRNINVRWRHFDLADIQEMPFEPNESERFGIRAGDVMICEGGEPGRAAVWRDDNSNMRFQKAIHRIRCDDALAPDWLVDVLQAHASSGRLSEYFTGTGIAHLTGVSLARVPIPVPPVMEQAVAVERVEQLLRVADSVVGKIDAATRRVGRSSQAVLSKAFRGELELGSGHGPTQLDELCSPEPTTTR
jgi:type I restriction enzyme S subunit